MRNRRKNLLKILSYFYFSLVTVIGFITIVASGGGGGDSGDKGGGNDDPIPKTGYFFDGPVEGLKYTTATQSGETDANGAFKYLAGEVVSFYVGDILVGQASGSAEISPFDLAGITSPETGIEVRNTINQLNHCNVETPFEVAVNIAVFLQSLDDDGDLSNGIQIPAQMHTLAAGVSLDFEQRLRYFPDDFQLRVLMAAGRGAGLWGGSRAIRNPGYALNTMYTGLTITPEIYAPSIYERDSGADGTVDQRYTYTYDNNGNLTISDRDTDGDGIVDQRYTYTYDNNGNLTISEEDHNADGTVDYRYTYTYDSNGNLTIYEEDHDADGTVDYRYTYTYDSNGNPTMSEKDSHADGTVDKRSNSTYQVVGGWAGVSKGLLNMLNQGAEPLYQ